ncbi:MAG: hypothetical protein OJF49_003526 [Ktedonobacterales bacterium]|jgi:hypothetical protein|nr:MAG: hypothetical protein OJF49_003526 [Ktedonobacterales bacterium]
MNGRGQPDDVIAETAARYREVLEWLTGEPMR